MTTFIMILLESMKGYNDYGGYKQFKVKLFIYTYSYR